MAKKKGVQRGEESVEGERGKERSWKGRGEKERG